MNNQKYEYSYLPDFLPEKVFRCPCLLYVVNKLLVAGIKGYRSICGELRTNMVEMEQFFVLAPMIKKVVFYYVIIISIS